jgi:cell division septum initiation protein DivIVA
MKILGEKKENLRRIAELKSNLKFGRESAATMDAEIAEANVSMQPYKNANAALMNIIHAAEKGHNLLLNTMTEINKEIGAVL